MATMEICSDPEDQQTSKMHEASLLAYRVWKAGRSVRLGFENPKPSPGGGNAKALLLGSKESSLVGNGPSALATHGSNEACNAPTTLLSESLLNKGKQAIAESEVPAPTSAFHRGQALSTQAAFARSNGEASEERLQRPTLPSFHREALTQSAKEALEAPSNSSHIQVLPKNSSPLSRIPELSSVVAGKGQSSEFQGATAERRVARGGFLAKELDPNKKLASRSSPSIFSATPHNAAQATHPSNGPGPTAPREQTPKAHRQ